MKNKTCQKTYRLLRMPVFCLLLFIMLFTTACSPENAPSGVTPTVIPTQTPPVTLPTPTDRIDFVLSEMKEVYFYTVNPETLETEAVSTVVKSDFADEPEELMVLIGDSLEDAGYEIGIKEAFVDGDNVVVDFHSAMCPVIGLTEPEEKAVLDVIAQSLLDNLAEQNGVVFRVMGEAYESDNFSFGLYYVYMKNHRK